MSLFKIYCPIDGKLQHFMVLEKAAPVITTNSLLATSLSVKMYGLGLILF